MTLPNLDIIPSFNSLPDELKIFFTSDRNALLSADRVYRYLLIRNTGAVPKYDTGPCENTVLFLMLNPSTADENEDDATIRRCISFAREWGYTWALVANLFALRATDPMELRTVDDPIGPQNDTAISMASWYSAFTVCAWGNHGWVGGRDRIVLERLLRGRGIDVRHLGLTKQGRPKHPLYLAKTTKPEPWA